MVNYTKNSVPYTRIIEHKHFEMFGNDVYSNNKTVISKEYSTEWKDGLEPYYPINDKLNSDIYARYKALAEKETDIVTRRIQILRYGTRNTIGHKSLQQKCSKRELTATHQYAELHKKTAVPFYRHCGAWHFFNQ